MTVLSPILLPRQNNGTKNVGQDVSITGVSISVIAANISTLTSERRTLSPVLLPTRARNFGGKGLQDNVSVTLTGVEITARLQSLTGATAILVPDGVELSSSVGDVFAEKDEGVQIENSDAETRAYSGSNIDDRTGFRVLPHELVTDPYSKNKVLKKFIDDHQWQENIRSRGTSPHRGPRSPEPDDQFVSTTTAPSDL